MSLTNLAVVLIMTLLNRRFVLSPWNVLIELFSGPDLKMKKRIKDHIRLLDVFTVLDFLIRFLSDRRRLLVWEDNPLD